MLENFYVYDLETLINFFSFTGKFVGGDKLDVFELSERRNDRDALSAHLSLLQAQGVRMVGYNNLGFDYPIIHELLLSPYTFDFNKAYQLCQQIINGQSQYGFGDHVVYFKDRLIPQVDIMKINHFDNKMKRTRLKDLQFAMRSDTVEDLPIPLGVPLTNEQMDLTLKYNAHDVTETEKFVKICEPLIKMRMDLLDQGVLTGDVLNYSDVKLGVEYLIKKIGRGKCFANNKPVQTYRTKVVFKDIILPTVSFENEELNEILDWFKAQSIWLSGSERPSHEARIGGIHFKFGVGGVHASVENRVFEATDTHIIRDIDVSGMYVAVAIANGFAPEHLGSAFTEAYKQLQSDRAKHKKGTTLNKILKLAGNGVYGNSNNPYSPFYDPQYTFSVTVNGQLQILQLVEKLLSIPQLKLIQANTDGVTVYMPRDVEPFFDMWCKEWEALTKLKLEHVNYKKMCIRDVNNYICLKEDGSVKAKGAYWYPKSLSDYEGFWNKDYSQMCVQKAIERVMLFGEKPEDAILCVSDPFDFMCRYKVTGKARVLIDGVEQQRTLRYYVSKAGRPAVKIEPPKGKLGDYKRKNGLHDNEYLRVLKEIPEGTWDERIHTKNKSRYTNRETSIKAGRLIKECNDASSFNWEDVDFDYYIEEIKKLMVSNV